MKLQGQTFLLHAYKAMFWESEQTLILADLHLGKSQHFRKNGIAVPGEIATENFNHLARLIHFFQPKEILILGDLFHSTYNVMWEVLGGFCKKYSPINFGLVPGNHDILEAENYEKAGIELLDPIIERGCFVFSHHPLEDQPKDLYLMHGHIHPGIRLVGKGRQSMRLPAFHFGKRSAVLPAFGAFTGLAMIYPEDGDQVFGITKNQKIFSIAS